MPNTRTLMRRLSQAHSRGPDRRCHLERRRQEPERLADGSQARNQRLGHEGPAGGIPRTQWLMSYSGFERLYYDTVASYKYWEADLGKLGTLVFLIFLRPEMEEDFLSSSRRMKTMRSASADWQSFTGMVGRSLVPSPAARCRAGSKKTSPIRCWAWSTVFRRTWARPSAGRSMRSIPWSSRRSR